MKKIIFYCSLFSICSINAFSQAKHAKADVWVDRFDFEGPGSKTYSNKTVRGEEWKPFSDRNNGGASIANNSYPVADKEHGKVLQLDYKLNPGAWEYAPFAGVYCIMQAASYPDHILYVAYDYKGSAHAFQYCTNDIEDYNYYRKDVPAIDEWTTILIPISELHQIPDFGTGKQVPLNTKELQSLQWLITGKDGDTGSFAIDNIRFVYTPIEGRNYQE